MEIFEKLATKIRSRAKQFFVSVKTYFKRLLFPLYLFPLKLITYTAYHLVKFLIKFIFAFIGLIFSKISSQAESNLSFAAL